MIPSIQVTAAHRIPLHPQELDRLASVCGLCVPEPDRDPLLDRFAREAASLFDAPMGLVTLVTEHEQFTVGADGLEPRDGPREGSFCAHTILQESPLVVEDAREDPRFAGVPAVVGPPFVRFYAGAPILDAGGLPLGSLCALGTAPHAPTNVALIALTRLATKVGIVFEARRLVRDLVGPYTCSDLLERGLARVDALLSPLANARFVSPPAEWVGGDRGASER